MRYTFFRVMAAVLLLGILPWPKAHAQETPAPEPGQKVSAVIVDIRDYPGPAGRIPSLARDLITLKAGGPYTREALESSLSLLKLSGRFADVSAEPSATPGGVEVVFRLKPCLQISDIVIDNEYPLFEQDILNVMTAYVGGYLEAGTIAAQEELIGKFLANEGFIEPGVSVHAGTEENDGTATLEVSLDKDRYYRLKSLDISGNRHFSDNRLKLRMSVWERSLFPGSSGRFIEKTLAQDLKDLVSLYRGSGYADVEVTHSLKRNEHTGNVRVTVDVREGFLYRVVFSGNESFFAFTLKKQLTLFSEGNRGGSGVRKSVRNIRELYLSSGYPKAQVKASEEVSREGGREVRTVRFAIEEGERALLGGVTFAGNDAVPGSDLAAVVQTGNRTYPVLGKKLFSRDVLDSDIQALETLYRGRGYGSARVGADLTWSPDGKSAAVVFRVVEGARTVVSAIEFEGLASMEAEKARSCISLREGSPFSPGALKNDETSLATCLSERGHPHVQVSSAATPSPDGSEAGVRFTVSEGPLVTMGNTYFNGNFRTRRRILQRELDMEEGDPFSLRKMVKGQNAIRDMNVFNAVTFKALGLREQRDRVTVLAELEEKKPYYVQAAVGYENNSGRYGSVRVGDRNLFGLNRDVWLSAQASEVNTRCELGVNAPRLLGTRVAGVYDLFREVREDFNQNFGLRTLGYNLALITRFGRRVFTSVNFRYERRDQYIIDDELQARLDAEKSPEELADQADSLDPRSVIVVSPGITYDTRDSFMNPRGGNFSSGTMDISTGLLNSRDIDNFVRYRADVRQYVSPLSRLTIAWMGKAGYIVPTRDTGRIPDDQLFYLGGVLNVRGYRENMLLYDENRNPVGGRLSLATSLEGRFRVIDGIELALFVDAGTIRDTDTDPVTPNTRYSCGSGLRYLTPIGPVSVVYARKVSPEPEESPYEWHFSLGYTF